MSRTCRALPPAPVGTSPAPRCASVPLGKPARLSGKAPTLDAHHHPEPPSPAALLALRHRIAPAETSDHACHQTLAVPFRESAPPGSRPAPPSWRNTSLRGASPPRPRLGSRARIFAARTRGRTRELRPVLGRLRTGRSRVRALGVGRCRRGLLRRYGAADRLARDPGVAAGFATRADGNSCKPGLVCRRSGRSSSGPRDCHPARYTRPGPSQARFLKM